MSSFSEMNNSVWSNQVSVALTFDDQKSKEGGELAYSQSFVLKISLKELCIKNIHIENVYTQ